MYGKHVALCLMEPGQDGSVTADDQATDAVCHIPG
jgi:hypothetical protein